MKLYIGNKNYSSWSMRPWVLLRHAAIPFEEILLRFDSFEPDSKFKTALAAVGAAGRVPVLVDGELAVWDSLAIAEYLHERFPEKALWPAGRGQRAHARSVCAEMHAGFVALRSHCPMNLGAALPDVGARLLGEQPALRADLERIVAMWTGLLDAHGGPFLFARFSIADAYFAPVVTRIRTYALPVPERVAEYVRHIESLPAMAEWTRDAVRETDFFAASEPYRTAPAATPA